MQTSEPCPRHSHVLALVGGVLLASQVLSPHSALAQALHDESSPAEVPVDDDSLAMAAAPREQLAKTWPVDHADPEASVPSSEQAMQNPLEMGYFLMDLIESADAATKRGDHAAAAKYYEAMIKAVPDRAVSYSKLCASYEALGNIEDAITNCKAALGAGGVTVEDFSHFVRLSLAKPGPIAPERVAELDQAIAHLGTQLEGPAGRLASAHLGCELAARLEDTARLEACTGTLASIAPDDPKTITFQWALAMKEGAYDKARGLLERAEKSGMPEAGVDQMRQAIAEAESQSSWTWQALGISWFVLALTSGIAIAALVFSRRRSGRLGSAS